MPTNLLVGENLRFDSRLALFHETKNWLAIADLHYGYELSLRTAGALFPAWGMDKIEARLASLIADYQPQTVLFLGDLVHTAAAEAPFLHWIAGVEKTIPQLILLRGNHDRHLKKIPLHDTWRIGRHLFHHGDRPIVTQIGDILVGGHLHPAETLSDGAGLRQKLPALLQTPNGYILPAFSPWAAGGKVKSLNVVSTWCISGKSIFVKPYYSDLPSNRFTPNAQTNK